MGAYKNDIGMKNLKMIAGAIWNALYVKPKNWLCGLQTDKVLHFLVSMVLVQLVFFLTGSLWLATLVACLIGVFKEVVIDKLISKGKVDAGDLWADAFGVCAGLVMLEFAAVLIHVHEWLW